MTVLELLLEAGVFATRVHGIGTVGRLQIDSRAVRPGDAFFVTPHSPTDRHAFLADARAAGATAAFVHTAEGFERAVELGMSAAQLAPETVVEDTWRIAHAANGYPSRSMKIVGVTGTNGKTTVAWLVRDLLRAQGFKAAYLGTLGFYTPQGSAPVANTTPYAIELANLLADAREQGVAAVAMEVSSHALAERRADGVEFDAVVFTNLTQDHLDYHGTMAEYERAKLRLFTDLPRQTAKRVVGALNVGDPVGRRWSEAVAPLPTVRFAVVPRLGAFGQNAPGIDLEGEALEVGLDRIHLVTQSGEGDHGFVAPLGGGYNVENLLSAVTAMKALGFSLAEVNEWGGAVRPVPGRFEPVPNERGISILVDYAHTPDALEKLLDAVRPLAQGRILTVFGCGGDRDRTKRPLMARAASSRSDLTLATSDNPRTEDPEAILDDVVAGMAPGSEWRRILDRPEAVATAIGLARPGDVVVIAGKGHESTQTIGTTKIHMDDRELARQALQTS